MKITRFEDVESWQKARTLTKMVYALTARDRFSKDFGLKDQIQRASVSIMANIAEGFDSGSGKSFINFLSYAYRSASEVQSLAYVALDCGYLSQSDFESCIVQAAAIKQLIGGFVKYLKHHGRQLSKE
ncbi:MAG TPA: four helix bundle protein [Bacteroidota bacterium]|nr:four helix bundle protein [Bacteroidota bacterium]